MHQINVFISHSWNYTDHYDTLYEWIFETPWNVDNVKIDFTDFSVPRDDPIHDARNAAELERRILERIKQADVVVCPTGMYATHSFWIGRELVGARKLNRPILGVNPWGQVKASSVVRSNASEVVGWTKKSVVGGIWRLTRG